MRNRTEIEGSPRTEGGAEADRQTIPVTLSHVKLAFAEKLGIPDSTVETCVDWEGALISAVPFQETAARQVGRLLSTRQTLGGAIVGSKIAIYNAQDWGENELIETVATLGFGSRAMVSRLNLAPFAHGHSLDLLLEAALGSSEVAGGISILGGVLKARPSGVVVFEHLDQAAPAVQQFLLEGVARGSMWDHRGRELVTRAFVVVFLNGFTEQQRGLGFSTAKKRSRRQDGGLLGAVDVAVTLEQPQPDAVAPVVLSQAVERFTKRTRLSVQLSTSAEDHLKGLPAGHGLTARRSRMLQAIEEAVADALRTDGAGGRDFFLWAEGDQLQAKVSAPAQDGSCEGSLGDDRVGSSAQIEKGQDD